MATDEEEVVLCSIQIDANGVLSIHPDFNRGRRAYVKETMKEFGRGLCNIYIHICTLIVWSSHCAQDLS